MHPLVPTARKKIFKKIILRFILNYLRFQKQKQDKEREKRIGFSTKVNVSYSFTHILT